MVPQPRGDHPTSAVAQRERQRKWAFDVGISAAQFDELLGARPARFLALGGEHLITLPLFEETLKRSPDQCLVVFDAHTDRRDEYRGESLSHATVVRRIADAVGAEQVFQFGARSGTRAAKSAKQDAAPVSPRD
ncbi:MAG: arginase family protein [Planctomycetes bacterium]|nr:arginase family protein [Planctomycetota bacterium]